MRTLLCYNISTDKELVNNMNDKELLKTIQNDIKNIDKCIEMCIDEEGIDYLKTIQQKMREQEIKILKQMAIKKALKEQQKVNYTIIGSNKK